jgi:uncharacterized protein YdaU (DUF1376 family)
MSERPWYRRFPDRFIAGTVSMTLEEKGAYSLVLDLMYVRGGPIPDEPRYIAGVCNCSVRKWNAIRQRLIDLGKIELVDGYLVNRQAEEELEISGKSSEERAESGRKGGEKSAENRAADKENKSLGQAELKHTRASLDTRKKEGPSAEKKGEREATILLDRHASSDAAMFSASEEIMGATVPEFLQRYAFPIDVVGRARELIVERSKGRAA